MYNNQGNNKQYTLSKQVTYLEVQKLTNWHNIYSEKKRQLPTAVQSVCGQKCNMHIMPVVWSNKKAIM